MEKQTSIKIRNIAMLLIGILFLGTLVFATTTITDNYLIGQNLNFSNLVSLKGGNGQNVLRIVPTSTVGNWDSRDGALFIDNSANSNSSLRIYTNNATQFNPLVHIVIDNESFNQPIIKISSISPDGANVDMRIDSLNPDIEFIETDETSPQGKFEIAVNGDELQFNMRNDADDSFEKMGWWRRKGEISATSEGFFNMLLNSTSATANYITLFNDAGSSGAQLGINWYNRIGSLSTARISSKAGTSYGKSELVFEVANSTKDLNTVLTLDYEGKMILASNKTSATCNSSNEGGIYYNSGTKLMYFCNSTDWRAMA